MAEESRLSITIDSRGAEQNANRMADALDRMEKSGDAAAGATERTTDALDEERKGLARLLGQINPTVAALDRLDDMQAKLARYKSLGLVERDTFVEYNQRLKAMRDELGETAEGMKRTGQSARMMANNLRMLPAQITDITVGLATGQAPLTVLLQQGGQLKDIFGGIGPAARAVGGYVMGLVNPFTLAASAAGTLALAYYQGSEQSDRLTDAIITTGNTAGTSASQLANFARQVGEGDATVSAATDAIAQLAEGGNRLTILYPQIAAAALSWSKQTGQSVEEVIGNFNDLAKNPVEAVKKLDAELNILTASEYANIQSLQEQGRTLDAARLASELYADALATRSQQMEQNLGTVERAWHAIIGTAKAAWDAMLDVGRKETPEQQLAAAYSRLEELTRDGRDAATEDPFRYEEVLNEIARLQGKIAKESEKAFGEMTNNVIQGAGKKAIDVINTTFTASKTQTEKLQKQLEDLDKARTAAQKAGAFTAEEEAKYATARKNIEQQIADIKEREAKKNAPKGQSRGVQEAENAFSRLYAQYDPAAQAARTLVKEQGQLQLLLDKGKITQEEYSKALAQTSLNYAAAIKGAQGLTQAEQYRAELDRQLTLERQQYAAQAAAVGMGDLQADRFQQRIALEQQTNARILQLQTELAQATNEKQRQALQAQIDLTREYLPQQIAAMQEGWAQMDAAMANPINGWNAAVQNFGVQARDIAGQTQYAFSSAFNTITDEVTAAIMEQKLSLSTLGDIGRMVGQQILASFVKMGVQMAANAVLAMTLGSTQTAASVAMAGTTAAAWAPAAALASLASFGGNSIPASAALTGTTALAQSLAMIPGLATGGLVNGVGTGTSDSNLRWLSHGEFVVNAEATRRNRALLEAINSNERMPTRSSGSYGASAPVVAAAPIVNLYEDASRAGQVQTRTENGGNIIDIWVANIMGDGEAHQALAAKYGLSTVGT